jgi:hypothetical protein
VILLFFFSHVDSAVWFGRTGVPTGNKGRRRANDFSAACVFDLLIGQYNALNERWEV